LHQEATPLIAVFLSLRSPIARHTWRITLSLGDRSCCHWKSSARAAEEAANNRNRLNVGRDFCARIAPSREQIGPALCAPIQPNLGVIRRTVGLQRLEARMSAFTDFRHFLFRRSSAEGSKTWHQPCWSSINCNSVPTEPNDRSRDRRVRARELSPILRHVSEDALGPPAFAHSCDYDGQGLRPSLLSSYAPL